MKKFIFGFVITVCQALVGAATVSAETTAKEKHITFYRSYGYQQSDHWHIPFRLWVSEAPGRVRRLSARGGRKVLRKAIGIEKLSDVQEQRYLDRC